MLFIIGRDKTHVDNSYPGIMETKDIYNIYIYIYIYTI